MELCFCTSPQHLQTPHCFSITSPSLGPSEGQQTYVQVSEVFIVVQGIANDKAVWDDKANICQSKNISFFFKISLSGLWFILTDFGLWLCWTGTLQSSLISFPPKSLLILDVFTSWSFDWAVRTMRKNKCSVLTVCETLVRVGSPLHQQTGTGKQRRSDTVLPVNQTSKTCYDNTIKTGWLTLQPWPSWVHRPPRASEGPSSSSLCRRWPDGEGKSEARDQDRTDVEEKIKIDCASCRVGELNRMHGALDVCKSMHNSLKKSWVLVRSVTPQTHLNNQHTLGRVEEREKTLVIIESAQLLT